MRELSVSEILEKSFDEEAMRQQALAEEHAEQVRPRDLGECGMYIARWKREYFRKNAARKATIYCRSSCQMMDGMLRNNYFLQLFINGEIVHHYYIRHEAFDVLVRELPKEEYPGVDLYTYLLHEPIKKVK